MKKLSALLIIATVALSYVTQAKAAEFQQLTLRLNKTATSSSINASICAKASSASAGTEASIQITFPTSFTISSTESNWITSFTDLPAGSTNWPGVSLNPTAISGKTLTFDSSNLTTTSLYCFRLTSENSNTGISTGSKLGTVITRNGSNTTIDRQNFSLNIVTSDNVTITATVPANPTDFEATLTKLTSGTTFPQDTNIQYQLDYGSSLSYPTAISVQAEWTEGTGGIEILDYVIGSASNAYGGTVPIIDTVNRTITWTIPSFPGNTTGQSVTFSLATNDNYTGGSTLSFSVMGRVLGPGTQTADSTVTSSYLYDNPITPTPTTSSNNSSSSPTATPNPTTTPTPTTPVELAFENVSLRTITAESAKVQITLNSPATVSLVYGTTPTQLNKRVQNLSNAAVHELILEPLEENTTYYFKVTATATGQTVTSDIFTFTTPFESDEPKIDLKSLIFISNENILSDLNTTTKEGTPILIIPYNTPYKFRFRLEQNQKVNYIRIFLRSRNVLGINNIGTIEPTTLEVKVIEQEPGIFVGTLKSPTTTGQYELFAGIKSGNAITEQEVADVKVSQRLKVVDQGGIPIENAQVKLFFYNYKTQIYQELTEEILNDKNPKYTETNGEIDSILPPGKYRVHVNAIGFKGKEATFVLGPATGDDYPVIELTKESFNIVTTTKFYWEIGNDLVHASSDFARRLASSLRFFTFINTAIVIILIALTALAAKERTNIPFRYFPAYLLHRLQKNTTTKILKGKIIDKETNKPLSNVLVCLRKNNNNKIVETTHTNSKGEFSVGVKEKKLRNLLFLSSGYTPVEFTINETNTENISVSLSTTSRTSKKEDIIWYMRKAVGSAFELLLFLTFVSEILLGFFFGWLIALPFALASLASLFLWYHHQKLHESS